MMPPEGPKTHLHMREGSKSPDTKRTRVQLFRFGYQPQLFSYSTDACLKKRVLAGKKIP